MTTSRRSSQARRLRPHGRSSTRSVAATFARPEPPQGSSSTRAPPLPVVVTQLHRRLRQLLIVRALRDAGEKPPAIARAAGITGPPKTAEYRLQVLSRQAMAWEPEELTGALAGLVEVDLVSKGLPVGGKPLRRGAAEGPTALLLWLSERVARRG